MVDLYSEIRGEARQEQAIQFLKQYWRVLLGIFIFAILMVAGGQIWSKYQRSEQEKSGHAFNQAMNILSKENNIEGAMKAFETLSDDGTASFRGLAALQHASLLLKRKKIDEAIVVYKNLSDDGGVDAEIRDMGSYLAAFLLYDRGKFEEASELLDNITGNGRPWRMQAMELEAYIALAQNDNDKATKILERIVSEGNATPTIKDRATTLLTVAQSQKAVEPKQTESTKP